MPITIKELYGRHAYKGKDVGIEIEMEGSGLNVAVAGWELHNDGSLRPNPEAMEYVLSEPIPHKAVASHLSALQGALKNNEAKLSPSDRCGVHVHINCNQYTVEQVLCIICTYLILEEVLVKWCGDDREGNLFALRAKDAEDFVFRLMNVMRHGNFNEFNGDYRYSSINVASLLKFGSLEFRPLRTPKDFSIINTWVEILMRIKEYAIGYHHPREIIETVSARGFSMFPKIVLGDMAELVQCKGMGVMIAEGARRVQEVAYIELLKKKEEVKQPQGQILFGGSPTVPGQYDAIAYGELLRPELEAEEPAVPVPPPNQNHLNQAAGSAWSRMVQREIESAQRQAASTNFDFSTMITTTRTNRSR